MAITGFQITGYSAAYDVPITNGLYTYTGTNIVLCEVRTDSGATGIGWVNGGKIVFQAMKEIAETVVGLDETAIERVWHTMYRPKLWGRRGLEIRSISAIDIALWDCVGRQTGLSIHKMLGGNFESVPAYMAGGYYQPGKGLDALQEEVAGRVTAGAHAIKMKIGAASIAEDTARIKAVREAVGSGVELLVDANNAYTRLDAQRMIRVLEKHDVYWFEEPLDPDDLEGCADLAAGSDCPIALGENEYTKFGFKDVLDKRAADVINADAQILGGITEWRKSAILAEASHIPVAPHGDQEIHVHLVAGVPNGLIVEYYDNDLNVLKDAMFEERLELDQDGRVTPPDRPGLGFDVNYEAMARFKTEAVTV